MMRGAGPIRITAKHASVPDILELVKRAFAYMEPRINPPSSIHRLSVDSINAHCLSGEIWAIGAPPHVCIFLKERRDRLYIGKLAVDARWRGHGLARRLIDLAAARATALGLSALELETRVELVENHSAFRRLGFVQAGEGRHPGFEDPTYIIMRKPV